MSAPIRRKARWASWSTSRPPTSAFRIFWCSSTSSRRPSDHSCRPRGDVKVHEGRPGRNRARLRAAFGAISSSRIRRCRSTRASASPRRSIFSRRSRRGNGPASAILALGYAGWAPGQLENGNPGQRLAALPGRSRTDFRRPEQQIRTGDAQARHRARHAVERSRTRVAIFLSPEFGLILRSIAKQCVSKDRPPSSFEMRTSCAPQDEGGSKLLRQFHAVGREHARRRIGRRSGWPKAKRCADIPQPIG